MKPLLLALVGLLSIGVPAAAAPRFPGEALPQAPTLLPGDARAAAASLGADTWLVGAQSGSGTQALAARFGAVRVLRASAVYRVKRERARAFADALKDAGLYEFSEPNQRATTQEFPAEPHIGSQWALGSIGATGFTPPAVHAESPMLGVVDDGFDGSHPEWSGASLYNGGEVTFGHHQNMVASVAGAPANGTGMAGVWPGMPLLVVGAGPYCGTTARGVDRAVALGAKIINMSYGFSTRCWTHLVATNYAYAKGVVLVAAAGNDGYVGDRGTSPGEDPHVITVAALAPGDLSPPWSNANNSVDLAAPGESVLAAVPHAFDADGYVDGYTFVDGTSFSSPIVAAATAWVRQERPALDNTQVTELIRTSARDLGSEGWDPIFGFGAFHLPTALTARAPRKDVLEPNDDVEWVDGRRFRRPDPPIWRGRGHTSFSGTLDQLEDPGDVYNIRLAPRSSARVSIRPSFGDPDLEVYDHTARTVYRGRGFITNSTRGGRRTDVLWLRNRSRRSVRGYVSVYPKLRSALAAGYRLSLRRVG